MAEDQPTYQPGSVSVSKMAEMLCLTERQVQNLANNNIVIRSTDKGRYMLIQSAHNYIKYLGEQKKSDKSEEMVRYELAEKKHKARISKIRADKEEREEKALAGVLIDREKTIAVWKDQLKQVRARCRKWLVDVKSCIEDIDPDFSNRLDNEFENFFEGLGDKVPKSYKKTQSSAKSVKRAPATPIPLKQVPHKKKPAAKKKAKATAKKSAAKRTSKKRTSKKRTTKKRSTRTTKKVSSS